MKPPIPVAVVLALGFAVAAFSAGCSKESADAKNVNVSAMTQALQGSDKDGRINACVELGKVGPKAAPAVPALIALLKDSDPTVRRLAAYVLGEIGPQAKAALPALKEIANDPDHQVVMQVVNSLRSIDPQNYSGMKAVNVSSP